MNKNISQKTDGLFFKIDEDCKINEKKEKKNHSILFSAYHSIWYSGSELLSAVNSIITDGQQCTTDETCDGTFAVFTKKP